MKSNIAAFPIPAVPGQPGGTATQLWVSDTFQGTFNQTIAANWALQDAGGSTLADGLMPLTDAQYAGWGAGSDNSYILGCYAANLGVTLAPT